MIIKLDEQFYLLSDERNFKIGKPLITRPNEFEIVSYHITLESAFESILNRKIRLSEAESFTDLVKDIEKFKAELKTAFKAIKE